MPGRTGGSLNWSLIFSLLIGVFRWRVGVGVEGGKEAEDKGTLNWSFDICFLPPYRNLFDA